MKIPIAPEEARFRLSRRRERLVRLLDLNAPDQIIEKERELISDALYELETGFYRVREYDEESA